MAENPDISNGGNRQATSPENPFDAGSQALSEALRSSFGIVKFVTFLLVCLFFGSGFFTVGPQERAIIIRLGKPVGEGEKALLGPGLHYSLPYPIEEYLKIPITAIQKVTSTVGWFATTPEEELVGAEGPSYAGAPINALVDGYVLTADNNIVHGRATVTYHIADPIGFIFNFVNASNAVLNALDNALLYAASRYQVDDILTRDKAGFQAEVRKRITALADQQNLGIVVEECLVQTRPPRQLQTAFESVLKAEVGRQKALNEAHNYENQVTNRAGADALARVNSAQSDRARLVNEVSSQAKRFDDLLPKFRQNPNLFAQQLLTETLGRVLTKAQDKIFLSQGSEGNQKELRLMLNRDAPKKAEDAKP